MAKVFRARFPAVLNELDYTSLKRFPANGALVALMLEKG